MKEHEKGRKEKRFAQMGKREVEQKARAKITYTQRSGSACERERR